MSVLGNRLVESQEVGCSKS